MKYIRAKDGIIETKKMTFDTKLTGDYVHERLADTIEELCDEFVVVRENKRPTPFINLEQVRLNRGTYGFSNSVVYGAIWTDKGLIYVAKMNNKGELELL